VCGRILELARAITMMTQTSVIAQHKKNGNFSFFFLFLLFGVFLTVFSFKTYFASIKTLWNGTFFFRFSFVFGSKAENESQIPSELLNGLAAWYLESQRGL